jgi:hypothetical protein
MSPDDNAALEARVRFSLFSKPTGEYPQKKFRDRTPDPMMPTHVRKLAPTLAGRRSGDYRQARTDPRSHESMDVCSNL